MTNKDYNFGIYDSILKLLPSHSSAATREAIAAMIGKMREKDETIDTLRAKVKELEATIEKYGDVSAYAKSEREELRAKVAELETQLANQQPMIRYPNVVVKNGTGG